MTRHGLSGRKVLLVEDEALIGMLLQDTLEELGCEVVGEASRFEDALAKAQTLAFDVAILDVNLEGQHTFPIAEALAARGSPFVFATGYGAARLPQTLQDVPVLQKPFQQQDLARALLAAVNGRR